MTKRILTKNIVASIAKNFRTRKEFFIGDQSAYAKARTNKWLDEICTHMTFGQILWTKESVLSEALKFSLRADFKRDCKGGYDAAQRNGWLDEVCTHMQTGNRSLDKEFIAKIAVTFRNRREFEQNDASAYQTARKNGWLDDVCAHMARKATGFNPDSEGWLYQLRFKLTDGTNIWKVGITNRNVKERLATMSPRAGVICEVTHEKYFPVGSAAKAEEKRLHDLGTEQGLRYKGAPFLRNGNTELFSQPLL